MSQRRFFQLSGRLQRQGGWPLRRGHIRLFDRDAVFDDLIAYRSFSDDGSFEVSFARESFNQEWGENEDLPQLYLYVIESDLTTGANLATYRRELPALTFPDGHEDLGDIELGPESRLSEDPSTVSDTAFEWKANCRLRLDDEAVAHVLSGVGPGIDAVLGTRRPSAAGLTVKVVDDLVAASEQAVMAQQPDRGVPEEFRGATPLGQSQKESFYDPFTDTLWLHRKPLQNIGLDGVKRAVARGLVERELFERFPGRRERLRQWYSLLKPLREYLRRSEPDLAMPPELARDLSTVWVSLLNQNEYVDYLDRTLLVGKSFAFSRRALPWQILAVAAIPVVLAGMAVARLFPGALGRLGSALTAFGDDLPRVHVSPDAFPDPRERSQVESLAALFVAGRGNIPWGNPYEALAAHQREQPAASPRDGARPPLVLAPLGDEDFEQLLRTSGLEEAVNRREQEKTGG